MLSLISDSVFTTTSSFIDIESGTGEYDNIQSILVNEGAYGDEVITTLASVQDWSDYNEIRFWVETDVVGTQWKLIFGSYEIEVNILNAGIKEQKRIWIKGLSGLENIEGIKLQCVNEIENKTTFGRFIVVKEDMIPDVELALKTKLEELGHNVHLQFPDKELVKEGTYPIISLYNRDIIEDNRRGTLNSYYKNYTSDNTVEEWSDAVPYTLEFQIDLISKYARDDRKLLQDFLALFDKNYMYLRVNDILLDVFRENIQVMDSVDYGKLYRKVIIIQVLTAHEHKAPDVGKMPTEIIIEKKLFYD